MKAEKPKRAYTVTERVRKARKSNAQKGRGGRTEVTALTMPIDLIAEIDAKTLPGEARWRTVKKAIDAYTPKG